MAHLTEQELKGDRTMVFINQLDVRFLGDLLFPRDALWLLGWVRGLATVDGTGDNADGAEHGNLHPPAGSGGHAHVPDDRPGLRTTMRIEAVDVLGGIALVGLLLYALLYKMDATLAAMLIGLFGLVLGRKTKRNNSNGDRRQ